MKTPNRIFELLENSLSKFYYLVMFRSLSISYRISDSRYWYSIMMKSRVLLCLFMLLGVVLMMFMDDTIISFLRTWTGREITTGHLIGLILIQIYTLALLCSVLLYGLCIYLYNTHRKYNFAQVSWLNLCFVFIVPLVLVIILFFPFWTETKLLSFIA